MIARIFTLCFQILIISQLAWSQESVYSRWERNMLFYGKRHCDGSRIQQLSTWEGSVWYYDGIRVFFQIADYTGDGYWNLCARYVRRVYRNYILKNKGRLPGWRVFPIGLQMDYERSGSSRSRKAVVLLSKNSSFARTGGGESFRLSRETAYVIHAYLSAEQLGQPRNRNLDRAVNYALGHLEQWAVYDSAEFVQPFMVALTCEALIRYYEYTGDSRIPAAVKRAADWLWYRAWAGRTFQYIVCKSRSADSACRTDNSSEEGDLNLLIAPVYAWLYRRTSSDNYRKWSDAIFESGVELAYLGGGKQFSQNYRWSFDFVRWRN